MYAYSAWKAFLQTKKNPGIIKICEVMQINKSDSQILNIKCQYFSMFINLPIGQTFLQKDNFSK